MPVPAGKQTPDLDDSERRLAVSLSEFEQAGDRIGPYKLLQPIGEGGCGVVYMAEQEQPVRRRVALKVIKAGMDTRQVLARFEAERQALALMDHPNIAKVLEAGATSNGRPFFVMELVKGIPITRFCDENRYSTQQRLELFIQVCQAIQHAHQKGIIHRDLKPTNILVADHDGRPVPKVIDFGLAKATNDQPLTDKTLFTAFEQFVGTPAYMSPEQAKLSGLDIDTRTDIYSLGVLLYELLTGKTPFENRRLLAAGLDEIRRIIREDEPPRPSTRLSTLDAAEQTEVARQRHSEPPRLLHIIRGDLDWIVMKCLEKDRGRRYETANGLAKDIQRYLGNELVTARPPSQAYRFQKLVRRNKLAFVAGSIAVAGVLLALTLSTWSFLKVRNALTRETNERQRADASAASASREKAKANEFLYDSIIREAAATRLARRPGYRSVVFDLLQRASVLNVPKKDVTELRREALACMGDYVGCVPIRFSNAVPDQTVEQMTISAGNTLAGFLMADGRIFIRELLSGAVLSALSNPIPARSFCFADRSDTLVSFHTNLPTEAARSQVLVWKRNTKGVWEKSRELDAKNVAGCFVAGKEPLLAVREGDGVLRFVRMTDRTVFFELPFASEQLLYTFSSDGRFFAGSTGTKVEIWDVERHKWLGQIESGLTFQPTALAMTFDGKYLACLSQTACVVFRTDELQHVVTVSAFTHRFSGFDFMPGTTVIALPLPFSNRLRLWDVLTGEEIAALQGRELPGCMSFSADGKLLLTAGGNEILLHHLGSTDEKINLTGHPGSVQGAAFSADGSRFVTACKDKRLREWHLDGSTIKDKMDSLPMPMELQSVAYSPDNRLLAGTLFGYRTTWLLHKKSGKTLLTSDPESGFSWCPKFSADSRYLASPSSKGLEIWFLDGGGGATPPNLVLTNSLPLDTWSAAFAGKYVVFLSPDYNGFAHLFCWSFLSNAPPNLIRTHLSPGPETFSVGPDARKVFALEGGEHIVTLEIPSGKELSSFSIGRTAGSSDQALEPLLSASPDGKSVAVAAGSRLGVEVWEPEQGRLLYPLGEETRAVTWLAWSPDSHHLAACRENGAVAIWDLERVNTSLNELGLKLPVTTTLTSNLAPPSKQQDDSFEFRLAHGAWNARFRQWTEAATDLARCLELEPDKPEPYPFLAPLLVKNGDTRKYDALRTEILRRFASAEDPGVMDRMLKSCLLLPSSAEQLDRIAEISDRGARLPPNHWAWCFLQFSKGFTQLRQGKFEAAAQQMHVVLNHQARVAFRDAQAWFVLAIASQHLNDLENARLALAKGKEVFQTQLSASPKDLGWDWKDYLICELLIQEAKRAVEQHE